MKIVSVFSILFLILLVAASLNLKTPNGELEGIELISRNGRSYNAFLGVPYAKKPDRFKVAELHPSWAGSKDATKFGNACPHFDMLSKSIIGDEDCLFLNVFTADPTQKLLPVIVWIHPGGFEAGRSDDFHAKYFMDEAVVLVTINYRLGPLGFLNTGDGEVPANLGMKDQVLALEWVQKNIKAFGGDSGKVTISGASAGGASVQFHLLSPMSKGLFHAAISQSGSVFSDWALKIDPLKQARTLGQYLKCPTTTSKDLVSCIKTKSPEEIVQARMQFKNWGDLPFLNFFAVSVEPKIGCPHKSTQYGKVFLPESPDQLLESGKINKVPWITGFTEDEGISISPLVIMNHNLSSDLYEHWEQIAPEIFSYEDATNDKERLDEISKRIYDVYFSTDEIGEESWQSLTDLISDRRFTHPVDKSARLHAKYSHVYPYVFSFAGGDPTLLRAFWGIKGEYGVGHLDDMQYLFNGFYGAPEYTKDDSLEPYEFSKKFVKLWVDFATNLVPKALWEGSVAAWEPVPKNIGQKPIKYLEISITTEIWETDIKDRMAVWEELSNVDAKVGKKNGGKNDKEEL